MSDLTNHKDEELMQMTQKGDFEAFEVLFNRYNKPLINFLFRYTNDFSKSEDLFQQVFIKVYEKRRTYKGDATFKTWLYTIAVNSALDMLRKTKKEKGNISLDLSTPDNFPTIEPLSPIATPQQSLISDELKDVLETAIMEVPEEFRTPFILARFQNLSYKEIAEIIGKTLATVRMRIHRAQKILEARLGKYLHEEDSERLAAIKQEEENN